MIKDPAIFEPGSRLDAFRCRDPRAGPGDPQRWPGEAQVIGSGGMGSINNGGEERGPLGALEGPLGALQGPFKGFFFAVLDAPLRAPPAVVSIAARALPLGAFSGAPAWGK